MITLADVDAHRVDLAVLSELARADLLAALEGVETPEQARVVLNDVLPALVTSYGSAAGTLAADWYDQLRDSEGAPGVYRSEPAELPDEGRVFALSGWASSTADLSDARLAVVGSVGSAVGALATGGVQRIIANASRDTITGASVRDPSAVGWQRVGSGSCDFCRALIARGDVYREATARFAAHDDCNCAAVPNFGGEPLKVRRYTPSDRYRSDYARELARERTRVFTESLRGR